MKNTAHLQVYSTSAILLTYGTGNVTSTLPSNQVCSTGADWNHLLVVGFNTFNSSGFSLGTSYQGATPQTLKIYSFTEEEYEYDPADPLVKIPLTIESGTESVLEDNAATISSFPYSVPLSRVDSGNGNIIPTLGVRGLKQVGCPTNNAFSVQRERRIEFSIIDINSNEGAKVTGIYTYRRIDVVDPV